MKIGFPQYVMGIYTFIGWLMVMFFLPTGMWAFVFENIAEFVQRPRQITDKEFEEKRDLLQQNVGKLLQIGKKLQLDKKDFEVKTRNW